MLAWQPPFEKSPVVWRLVTDLEVVDPARCAQDMTAVHDTIAAAIAKTGAVVHELPAVDLAPNCQQAAGRSIDAGPLADEVKTYLAANYTNVYHRPLLVYVNNLAAPLPSSLTDSLQLYLDSFTDPHVVPLDVGLVPAAAIGFKWDLPLQFVAVEDPQFATDLDAAAMATLPFESQLHDPGDLTPLMPLDTVLADAGDPWKTCFDSPAITRYAGTTAIPKGVIAPLLDAQNPPAFAVDLPPKILVPAVQFMRDTVVVRWEICRRWCEHAFRDEAGTDHPSWLTTPTCVKSSP
jgi:hypothetical protein